VKTAIVFTSIGLLLVVTAMVGSVVRRLPLTTTLLYLAAGVALGPAGAGLVSLDVVRDAAILETLTEIAVLVSLFAAGLKLRQALSDSRWRAPVRLATIVMVLTIGLATLAGFYLLALPLGAAVLLGAILAPTDPVLASDVQVGHPTDGDRLRFALTGEAALNDGTAFPFVMLGLGLLGAHELGAYGWRWLAVDVLWAGAAGLAIGWGLGWAVSRLVLWLRREKKEAVGLDDLLALGLIALAYGVALLCKSYGFLAVFAAGFALRREERRVSQELTGGDAPVDVQAAAARADETTVATSPDTATAYMAEAALGFTEQLERLAEVVVVLAVGALLSGRALVPEAWGFALLLILVIRPLAVLVGAPMRRAPRLQRRLTMWFGIRGIGSLYYLAYATEHGLPEPLAERMAGIVLTAVTASVLLHGISVTPLMRHYEERTQGRG
jgi:NhaP-type Na+/H+ or K+/H+ antiporter